MILICYTLLTDIAHTLAPIQICRNQRNKSRNGKINRCSNSWHPVPSYAHRYIAVVQLWRFSSMRCRVERQRHKQSSSVSMHGCAFLDLVVVVVFASCFRLESNRVPTLARRDRGYKCAHIGGCLGSLLCRRKQSDRWNRFSSGIEITHIKVGTQFVGLGDSLQTC